MTKQTPPAEPATPAPETVAKADFDAEQAARIAAQVEANKLADALLANVPEKFKPLIPEGASATDKAAWYQKAKESGVFDEPKPAVPPTDTGRPSITPQEPDISELNPMQRIALGLKK